ncbi:unnamed protein product [Phaedon cochleariae]|uniref:Uncharacterized protein n=1 Tax=Phaedon cochleariae TaxID=80249 RepID=A0A9P0DR52_PHACE|nr:unnamed protein product [Phaedon cochleariae]
MPGPQNQSVLMTNGNYCIDLTDDDKDADNMTQKLDDIQLKKENDRLRCQVEEYKKREEASKMEQMKEKADLVNAMEQCKKEIEAAKLKEINSQVRIQELQISSNKKGLWCIKQSLKDCPKEGDSYFIRQQNIKIALLENQNAVQRRLLSAEQIKHHLLQKQMENNEICKSADEDVGKQLAELQMRKAREKEVVETLEKTKEYVVDLHNQIDLHKKQLNEVESRKDELEVQLRNLQEETIDMKQTKLIGIISTFLLIHPFGIGFDSIFEYVQRLDAGVSKEDVEYLLMRCCSLFRFDPGKGWTLNTFSSGNHPTKGTPHTPQQKSELIQNSEITAEDETPKFDTGKRKATTDLGDLPKAHSLCAKKTRWKELQRLKYIMDNVKKKRWSLGFERRIQDFRSPNASSTKRKRKIMRISKTENWKLSIPPIDPRRLKWLRENVPVPEKFAEEFILEKQGSALEFPNDDNFRKEPGNSRRKLDWELPVHVHALENDFKTDVVDSSAKNSGKNYTHSPASNKVVTPESVPLEYTTENLKKMFKSDKDTPIVETSILNSTNCAPDKKCGSSNYKIKEESLNHTPNATAKRMEDEVSAAQGSDSEKLESCQDYSDISDDDLNVSVRDSTSCSLDISGEDSVDVKMSMNHQKPKPYSHFSTAEQKIADIAVPELLAKTAKSYVNIAKSKEEYSTVPFIPINELKRLKYIYDNFKDAASWSPEFMRRIQELRSSNVPLNSPQCKLLKISETMSWLVTIPKISPKKLRWLKRTVPIPFKYPEEFILEKQGLSSIPNSDTPTDLLLVGKIQLQKEDIPETIESDIHEVASVKEDENIFPVEILKSESVKKTQEDSMNISKSLEEANKNKQVPNNSHSGFSSLEEEYRFARILTRFNKSHIWSPELKKRLQEFIAPDADNKNLFRLKMNSSIGTIVEVSYYPLTAEEIKALDGVNIPDKFPEEYRMEKDSARKVDSPERWLFTPEGRQRLSKMKISNNWKQWSPELRKALETLRPTNCLKGYRSHLYGPDGTFKRIDLPPVTHEELGKISKVVIPEKLLEEYINEISGEPDLISNKDRSFDKTEEKESSDLVDEKSTSSTHKVCLHLKIDHKSVMNDIDNTIDEVQKFLSKSKEIAENKKISDESIPKNLSKDLPQSSAIGATKKRKAIDTEDESRMSIKRRADNQTRKLRVNEDTEMPHVETPKLTMDDKMMCTEKNCTPDTGEIIDAGFTIPLHIQSVTDNSSRVKSKSPRSEILVDNADDVDKPSLTTDIEKSCEDMNSRKNCTESNGGGNFTIIHDDTQSVTGQSNMVSSRRQSEHCSGKSVDIHERITLEVEKPNLNKDIIERICELPSRENNNTQTEKEVIVESSTIISGDIQENTEQPGIQTDLKLTMNRILDSLGPEIIKNLEAIPTIIGPIKTSASKISSRRRSEHCVRKSVDDKEWIAPEVEKPNLIKDMELPSKENNNTQTEKEVIVEGSTKIPDDIQGNTEQPGIQNDLKLTLNRKVDSLGQEIIQNSEAIPTIAGPMKTSGSKISSRRSEHYVTKSVENEERITAQVEKPNLIKYMERACELPSKENNNTQTEKEVIVEGSTKIPGDIQSNTEQPGIQNDLKLTMNRKVDSLGQEISQDLEAIPTISGPIETSASKILSRSKSEHHARKSVDSKKKKTPEVEKPNLTEDKERSCDLPSKENNNPQVEKEVNVEASTMISGDIQENTEQPGIQPDLKLTMNREDSLGQEIIGNSEAIPTFVGPIKNAASEISRRKSEHHVRKSLDKKEKITSEVEKPNLTNASCELPSKDNNNTQIEKEVIVKGSTNIPDIQGNTEQPGIQTDLKLTMNREDSLGQEIIGNSEAIPTIVRPIENRASKISRRRSEYHVGKSLDKKETITSEVEKPNLTNASCELPCKDNNNTQIEKEVIVKGSTNIPDIQGNTEQPGIQTDLKLIMNKTRDSVSKEVIENSEAFPTIIEPINISASKISKRKSDHHAKKSVKNKERKTSQERSRTQFDKDVNNEDSKSTDDIQSGTEQADNQNHSSNIIVPMKPASSKISSKSKSRKSVEDKDRKTSEDEIPNLTSTQIDKEPIFKDSTINPDDKQAESVQPGDQNALRSNKHEEREAWDQNISKNVTESSTVLGQMKLASSKRRISDHLARKSIEDRKTPEYEKLNLTKDAKSCGPKNKEENSTRTGNEAEDSSRNPDLQGDTALRLNTNREREALGQDIFKNRTKSSTIEGQMKPASNKKRKTDHSARRSLDSKDRKTPEDEKSNKDETTSESANKRRNSLLISEQNIVAVSTIPVELQSDSDKSNNSKNHGPNLNEKKVNQNNIENVPMKVSSKRKSDHTRKSVENKDGKAAEDKKPKSIKDNKKSCEPTNKEKSRTQIGEEIVSGSTVPVDIPGLNKKILSSGQEIIENVTGSPKTSVPIIPAASKISRRKSEHARKSVENKNRKTPDVDKSNLAKDNKKNYENKERTSKPINEETVVTGSTISSNIQGPTKHSDGQNDPKLNINSKTESLGQKNIKSSITVPMKSAASEISKRKSDYVRKSLENKDRESTDVKKIKSLKDNHKLLDRNISKNESFGQDLIKNIKECAAARRKSHHHDRKSSKNKERKSSSNEKPNVTEDNKESHKSTNTPTLKDNNVASSDRNSVNIQGDTENTVSLNNPESNKNTKIEFLGQKCIETSMELLMKPETIKISKRKSDHDDKKSVRSKDRKKYKVENPAKDNKAIAGSTIINTEQTDIQKDPSLNLKKSKDSLVIGNETKKSTVQFPKTMESKNGQEAQQGPGKSEETVKKSKNKHSSDKVNERPSKILKKVESKSRSSEHNKKNPVVGKDMPNIGIQDAEKSKEIDNEAEHRSTKRKSDNEAGTSEEKKDTKKPNIERSDRNELKNKENICTASTEEIITAGSKTPVQKHGDTDYLSKQRDQITPKEPEINPNREAPSESEKNIIESDVIPVEIKIEPADIEDAKNNHDEGINKITITVEDIMNNSLHIKNEPDDNSKAIKSASVTDQNKSGNVEKTSTVSKEKTTTKVPCSELGIQQEVNKSTTTSNGIHTPLQQDSNKRKSSDKSSKTERDNQSGKNEKKSEKCPSEVTKPAAVLINNEQSVTKDLPRGSNKEPEKSKGHQTDEGENEPERHPDNPAAEAMSYEHSVANELPKDIKDFEMLPKDVQDLLVEFEHSSHLQSENVTQNPRISKQTHKTSGKPEENGEAIVKQEPTDSGEPTQAVPCVVKQEPSPLGVKEEPPELEEPVEPAPIQSSKTLLELSENTQVIRNELDDLLGGSSTKEICDTYWSSRDLQRLSGDFILEDYH